MDENKKGISEGQVFNPYQLNEMIEIMNGTLSLEELNKLIENGIIAKKNTYSPYSKFPVGCCLLTNDDKYILGENLIYYV